MAKLPLVLVYHGPLLFAAKLGSGDRHLLSLTIIKQMLGNVDNCFITATGTNHPSIVDDLFTNLSEPLDTTHTTTWAMSIIGQQMSLYGCCLGISMLSSPNGEYHFTHPKTNMEPQWFETRCFQVQTPAVWKSPLGMPENHGKIWDFNDIQIEPSKIHVVVSTHLKTIVKMRIFRKFRGEK